MTKRLDTAFARIRDEKRTGLVPYVTVGFPTVEDTLAIVPAIEAAGAVALELGVPYTDPLADGPTIQAASYRAVQAGVDARVCIDLVARLREGRDKGEEVKKLREELDKLREEHRSLKDRMEKVESKGKRKKS